MQSYSLTKLLLLASTIGLESMKAIVTRSAKIYHISTKMLQRSTISPLKCFIFSITLANANVTGFAKKGLRCTIISIKKICVSQECMVPHLYNFPSIYSYIIDVLFNGLLTEFPPFNIVFHNYRKGLHRGKIIEERVSDSNSIKNEPVEYIYLCIVVKFWISYK